MRVVYALEDAGEAAARVAALALEPAGDDPGGAAVAFEPDPEAGIASGYAPVPAGDYALVADGRPDGTAVAFEGGLAYTLFLADTGGEGGAGRFVALVDGAAP